MLVQELLLKKLEDLPNKDYETFKWYLNMPIVDGCERIPKCKLEGQNRENTVSCMVNSYGEAMAVTVSVEILRKIHFNSIADDLQSRFEEGRAATPSGPSTLNPAAGAAMSAQHGGMVIAPVFTSSSAGSVNINIHQK